MSTHDRGAFGALLAEAKALGARSMTFTVLLDADQEDESRWEVESTEPSWQLEHGRTGEEALRRLVEKLRP